MGAQLTRVRHGRRNRCRLRWTGDLNCSALIHDAIAHFRAEVKEKVKSGQAKLMVWDSIKDNPPADELNISPIVAIPHKSKQF